MRGDQEQNVQNIHKDSPTVNKINIKLMLIEAVRKKWEIGSSDVTRGDLETQSLSHQDIILFIVQIVCYEIDLLCKKYYCKRLIFRTHFCRREINLLCISACVEKIIWKKTQMTVKYFTQFCKKWHRSLGNTSVIRED